MEFTRLIYNDERIGFRINNESNSEVFDFNTYMLDTVLVEKLDSKAKREEELFLFGHIAQTQYEHDNRLDISDKTNKFDKWLEAYEYCGRPLLTGSHLYVCNGVAVANICMRVEEVVGGYTIQSVALDFIFKDNADFSFLIAHGWVEEEDRPRSYPNVCMTSVSFKDFRRIMKEFKLIQIGNYTPVFIKMKDGYKQIDDSILDSRLLDEQGGDTVYTVREYREFLLEQVMYKLSDVYLDDIGSIVENSEMVDLETL